MTYYKGLIINYKFLDQFKNSDPIGYSGICYNIGDIYIDIDDIHLYISNFKNLENEYELELKRDLLEALKRNSETININNENLIQFFNKHYNFSNQEKINEINNISSALGGVAAIVYELVKDKEGNLFGKELYTGELFPIFNCKCEEFNYSIEITKTSSIDTNFHLKVKPNINVSSLLKCENFIVGHKVATLNDFERYMNKFRGKRLLKRTENKEIERFKHNIISLSHENVFKEDFSLEEKTEKKDIVRESQSIETSLMEDIEYNLMRFKRNNEELYLKYKEKYENLLKKDIIKTELASLLGEIEYSILFEKRNIEEILDIIKSLKVEYFTNFISQKEGKTEIDLKKIDKINELFLRMKDKFTPQNQREVLRNIAFLYLMETYENKDLVTIDELSNSYFIMHLKTIVWWINCLIDEDIIECSYIISLRDDLTIEIVLDLIKSIKFKEISKDKIKEINNIL